MLHLNQGGFPLVIKCLVISFFLVFPFIYFSSYLESSSEGVYKAVASLLGAIVVGYAFKENRTVIDKIKNYDFSKFNLRKKQEYVTANEIFFKSGADENIYNVVYYIALLVVPFMVPKATGYEFFDDFLRAFLAIVPWVSSLVYLVYFNERKIASEDWLSKLDKEKRVEEHRVEVLKRLREKIESSASSEKKRTAIELESYLSHLKQKKEES